MTLLGRTRTYLYRYFGGVPPSPWCEGWDGGRGMGWGARDGIGAGDGMGGGGREPEKKGC